MKSSQPPSLATWFLEHLVPGGKNEALAGDLLEDFRRRGSVAWYWRQVIMAILVGFSKELRTRWIGIVFAIIYSSAIPWKQIGQNLEIQSLLLLGLRLAWPVSLIYQIGFLTLLDAVALLAALIMYLGATRSLNLPRFLRGLLVAILVLSLGNIGVALLWIMHLPPLFFYYVVWRLPLFLGLVLAMWVARPSAVRAEATWLPE
ncbi:MAG TPA: hypothetical protein VOA41_16825 [Candidatus Dormibacteraeota bacterium]|nr:hypothetical protein [Candidatus Dormibacteraeota bacterium]